MRGGEGNPGGRGGGGGERSASFPGPLPPATGVIAAVAEAAPEILRMNPHLNRRKRLTTPLAGKPVLPLPGPADSRHDGPGRDWLDEDAALRQGAYRHRLAPPADQVRLPGASPHPGHG